MTTDYQTDRQRRGPDAGPNPPMLLWQKAFDIQERAKDQRREMTKAEADEVQELLNACERLGGFEVQPRVVQDEGVRTPHGTRRDLDLSGKLRFTARHGGGGMFRSFGEFCHAVVRNPGDNRLMNAASEGAGTEGGFAVPMEYASRILDSSIEGGLAQLCDTYMMGSQQLSVWGISDSNHSTSVAGFSTFWIGENTQAGNQQPTLREIQLKANKLLVLTKVSNELASDAPGFEQELAKKMAQAIRWETDKAIVRGTGAGQPQGILNAPCLISVAEDGSQTADTITFSNIVRMYDRLLPESYRTAVWLVSPSCRSQLYSLQIEGTSNSTPAFVPPGGLPNAPNGTLLGLPVIFTEHCSILGDQGDIILADLQSYAFGLRMDVTVSASIHAGFDYDQVWWRAVSRCDGQAKLNAVRTLRDGTTTASTFVVLDDRTG